MFSFDNSLFDSPDSGMKSEYEINVSTPGYESEEFSELYLFCDLEENVQNLPTPCSALTPTKDISENLKNHPCEEKCDLNRIETSSESHSHMVVPFEGKQPKMDAFQKQVQNEMSSKGVNKIICEALEINNESEFFDESPQIIRVKKRKSKQQLKALEEEFSKGDDWSKEFMNQLAEKIQLDPSQVYKWHWDQISKKYGKAPKKQGKEAKKSNKKRRNVNSTRNKRVKNTE